MVTLKATLAAVEQIQEPGQIRHLPFEWPKPPGEGKTHPPHPPPMAEYLRRRQWLLARLLPRGIPGE